MTKLENIKKIAVSFITRGWSVRDHGETALKVVDSYYKKGVCGRIVVVELFCIVSRRTFQKLVVVPSISKPHYYLIK